LTLKPIDNSAAKFWIEMDGVVNGVGAWKVFKCITFGREAGKAMTSNPI
jgi:hypothetical protein